MKTNLGLKWMRMLQWACALWLSVAAMFAAAAEAPVDPNRRVETVTLDNGEISRTFQGTLRGR